MLKNRFRVKGNILIYYTAIIFFMVVIVSAIIGFLITLHQKKHIVLTHTEFYPELVKLLSERYPVVIDKKNMKEYPVVLQEESLERFMVELLKFEGIEDAAFIDRSGTVISASSDSIKQKNFIRNQDFIDSLSGSIKYNMMSPEKNTYLEIFIPLKKDERTIAVLYLSEGGSHLEHAVGEGSLIVWILISTGGFLLYILLFSIFYYSYKRQKEINEELNQTQNVTIYALGYQAELRDLETGNHIERTSQYVKLLAEGLRENIKYHTYMSTEYIQDLIRSSPLHDIGKVAIPDSILLKPARLNEDEFNTIKKHTLYGSDILEKAEQKLSFPSFFKIAIQMCRHHHEKWDGTGYPSGLSGEDIPLSARIMSIADIYDALRSKRPYKEEISHEKSVEIIISEKGKSLDPEIVDVFLKREKEFEQTSEILKDTEN